MTVLHLLHQSESFRVSGVPLALYCEEGVTGKFPHTVEQEKGLWRKLCQRGLSTPTNSA